MNYGNAEQITAANRMSRVISSYIKCFAERLPEGQCAAIVLGSNVIEIKEVISLEYFGLIAIEGLCRTVVSPQYCGAPIRVLLAPTLQGLTLIGVLRTEEASRSKIGFSIQGQEVSPVQSSVP